ncbi:MAG TPA: response regulator, partial [Puia sp.]|nr:response regulator [Puia sp.]
KAHSCLKSSSGALYFGGVNGFNVFFPDSIRKNAFDPPLVITHFQVFNKEVPIAGSENDPSLLKKTISETKTITLPYDQSVFSFEFASLNYTVSEKKQYAYMLEGFDKSWNYTGARRIATYTHLDPGKYTFKVRGMRNDGEWSSRITSLELTIPPPFWLTWWFKLLVAISVTGLVFVFFGIRVRTIKIRQAVLEREVKERTERLAESMEEERKARLDAEKARAEAEEANRSKSVFLATMSHEIRTPMNGVIGMSSLLAETPLTDQQREFTDIVRSCGESLLNVINDILDFSKIESGNMELEEKDFNLRGCVEDVLDIFATKAAKSGLDLVYQLDDQVPLQIVGDSLRIKQILTNLVGNAMKFTTYGEVFVGITVSGSGPGDEVELRFEVKDTGIGIAADKLERLFKAFSQVDSSTTRLYGGTGLGLAISEKLVKLMGGTVDVISQTGQGSVFSFTVRTRRGFGELPVYTRCNMSEHAGEKILVVDDNKTNRTILRTLLGQWKLTPVLAESGAEALNILSKDPSFALIITDMKMPEMDGVELARSVRQRYPKIPVILLSSVSEGCRKEDAVLFSSILAKPIKHHMLCKHILDGLRHKDKSLPEEQTNKQKLPADFSQKYPLRILVAEDNPVNQHMILYILNKLGYEPGSVDNGRLALEAVSHTFYDIILMDMQMPEIDGLEATRIIRQQPEKQPVIIALTANAMQGDREECLEAGMDDYLSKPIQLEDLVEKIEKWALQIRKKNKV